MSGTTTTNPTVPAGGITRLRSPQIATRAFGVNSPGNVMQAVPRVKFEFYVQFVLGPSAQQMIGTNAQLANYADPSGRGMSFKVKTVDKPKVNLQTEELNQYNKKVLVYKKIEYGEASVRLHDTVDDSILATWVDYFTYYFADSRQKAGFSNQSSTPAAAYEQSPYSSSMTWDSGWGFQPIVNNDTNFFTNIIVYAMFANTFTAWSYVNPKITSIDWQQFDYSSSDPEEVNVQFKYEAINYIAFGQPINNGSNSPNNALGFMPNFGYNTDDYINGVTNSTVIKNPDAKSRIFNSPATQNITTPPVNLTTNLSNPSGNIPTPTQFTQTAQTLINQQASLAPGASNPLAALGSFNPLPLLGTTTALGALNPSVLGKIVSFGSVGLGAALTNPTQFSSYLNSGVNQISSFASGSVKQVTSLFSGSGSQTPSTSSSLSQIPTCIAGCVSAAGNQAAQYINSCAAGL
jgi:hypothetical protein